MTEIAPTADPLDAAEAANRTGNVARRAMIDSQLRTSGVNAPFVLKRMAQVAREDHVPAHARGTAYVDRAIALGDGRWIAAPLFYGAALEEADPLETDCVLLVDGGSGYMAELLRPLVGELTIVSVEDALESGPDGEGANLLVIDGAVEEIPEYLARRLAEGARIVTGIATRGVTRLAVGRHNAGKTSLIPVRDMGIPVLSAFDKPKGWSF